jgi:dipeptidyl aminopeptidase/acylaminoacyl peptidase
MLKLRLPIIALVFICSSLAVAQTYRGLLPTDLSAIKEVSDAQISPDGSRVVYVVSETAPDRSGMISHLWIVPAVGGDSKRLTIGEANETTPRWSPDGKWIALYSNRDQRDGLWIVPAEGGQPKLLTHVTRTNFHLKGAGESFTWSPDSKRIAFLSSTESLNEAEPAAPSNVGRAAGRTQSSPLASAVSALPDDPRVITRLQYKSRTSFSDNLRSHIFVVDLQTRRLRQLTDGKFYEHSINWSPNGDEIVFVSNRETDPDKVNNTDLFTVNIQTSVIRQLTKTKGCEWQPVFSPDGSEIGFLATKREITTIDSVAEDAHAYIIPALGGEARDANQGVDRRVSMVRWQRAGRLCIVISDRGRSLVYVTNGSRLDHLFERARVQITSLSFATNGSAAYTFNDPVHPSEVYVHTLGVTDDRLQVASRKLTSVNSSLLAPSRLSEPIEFIFTNEGFDIQGWLVPPLNSRVNLVPSLITKRTEFADTLKQLQTVFGDENPRVIQAKRQLEALDQELAVVKSESNSAETQKHPVILSIHGGPHGMYGYGFNANAQAMAAHGYAVLLINPRGSTGYGQKFADGCLNDWGGGDYRDLMRGVDVALARFPFLDKDRMGVMGGSYGGYMTNWVITQTGRFKAAVASASLSNLISFYSTSLYQDLIHAEFNGYPWDNFEILWDRSPLKHIKKAQTPLMLIHGENDNDVHITQAEEMYTALRMRGVECVFVRYPREGHGLREPRHREDSMARTLQWFDRFLKR